MTNVKTDFTVRDVMRSVYMASPYFLGREALGYSRFCETQLEWSEYLATLYNPREPKRTWSLVLAPRETLKSTFWTVTQAIFLLLNNPNLTILIASETITNSDAFLAEIKDKMRSEEFRRVFGDLVSNRFDRTDAMNLVTRTRYTKESNIETAGLGKSITGRHYDVVIADDIAGVQDRVSAAKRAVTLAFMNDIVDVLRKDVGYLQVIGTRWHLEDIYAHIKNKIAPAMEQQKVGKFNIWERPAHKNGDPNATAVNYPRLLSNSKLKELRTVKQGKDGLDISTYMAQYELNPLSPDEQIFKSFTYEDPNLLKFVRFVLWTDPALSKKDSACYSASIVLAEVAGASYWFVLYASIKRRAPSEITADHNRIFRMIRDMYGISGDAYMEDNGFQAILASNTISASADEKDPVPTVGRTSTENKIARIRSMEPYISQGFIRFRSDWQTAPEGYSLLIGQLTTFPQGQMDGPDSLQCAHKQTQESISFRRV